MIRWQRGDTLVEITIAMAILAMVLTSSVVLGVSAMHIGGESRQRSQAAELAQEQAEGLRSFRDTAGWTAFNTDTSIASGAPFHMDSTGGSWAADTGSFVPTIGGNPSAYTIAMTSTSLSASERRFDITANWNAPGGRADSLQFTYYLVDPKATSGYVAP
jgi:Tfp pilus assembly protein PilV